MSVLDPLLPTALLGTDRAPEITHHLREAGVPEALFDLLATSDGPPSVRLLRAAGVLVQCQRVAQRPRSAEAAQAPTACERDGAPPLKGREWISWIDRILDEGPPPLQHALLVAIVRRGYRLHATRIWRALDLAVATPRLAPLVADAVGPRGRWLAAHDDRWRAALGAALGATPPTLAEDTWAHGRIAARVAFLREARGRTPDAARERLDAELPQLGAEERARLVAALEIGLGTADEPLLERLLHDRAAEVRRLAGRLLLQLPSSRRSARMAAVLAGLLRRAKTGGWVVDAPPGDGEADPTLGLEPRPKSDDLGARAHGLFQIVRSTPLAFWPSHTGMSPREVLAWAARTDWHFAILRGIHDAFVVAPDRDWGLALLAAWHPAALGASDGHVEALLPRADRETLWSAAIARARDPDDLVVLVRHVASASHPEDRLGDAIATQLAGRLRPILATARCPFGPGDRDALLRVVASMPDAALASLCSLPREPDLYGHVEETVARVEQLAHLRLRLALLPAAARPPSPPSSPSPT